MFNSLKGRNELARVRWSRLTLRTKTWFLGTLTFAFLVMVFVQVPETILPRIAWTMGMLCLAINFILASSSLIREKNKIEEENKNLLNDIRREYGFPEK